MVVLFYRERSFICVKEALDGLKDENENESEKDIFEVSLTHHQYDESRD